MHSDGTGAAGIEAAYNDVLAGTRRHPDLRGRQPRQRQPDSRTVTATAVDGGTVRLTIDQNLQYTVQRYLDAAVPESQARGGAGRGARRAHRPGAGAGLVGHVRPADPDHDQPTSRRSTRRSCRRSSPARCRRSITFAAALQKGLIKPKTVLQRAGHASRWAAITVNDAWSHPTERFTATGVLAESSNVGTLKIAQQLGPAAWYDYEQRFGVGSQTGIELPGESGGFLPPMSSWSDSTFANLPFGQGESMTVLQLASIYQTIANDGVRVPPRIVQSVTRPDGSTDADDAHPRASASSAPRPPRRCAPCSSR